MNAILSSINNFKHVLHLYSGINKHLIHIPALYNSDGKTAYMTGEDASQVEEQFHPFGIKFSILSPIEINQISNYKKVVIDGDSINSGSIKPLDHRRKIGEELMFNEYADHAKREEHICNNFKKQSIICTYNINNLTPEEIKILAKQHDNLILTTDTSTILSSESLLDKRIMGSELIDEYVKRDLEAIVLALLTKNPMCGRDINMKIYNTFNVLLSAGTLYPLLHQLEKKNLLESHQKLKIKLYSIKNLEGVRNVLNTHIEAKNFIKNFLQLTINNGGGGGANEDIEK